MSTGAGGADELRSRCSLLCRLVRAGCPKARNSLGWAGVDNLAQPPYPRPVEDTVKITAHMKSGDIHVWDNLAGIDLLTTTWARLATRGDDWDTTVPRERRQLGIVILLNIDEMVYWVQEWDALDDVESGGAYQSWLQRQPDAPPEAP